MILFRPLRRTEFCETAFPGPFFFRHAGTGSAQQIVPPGKGRQIQAQAAARSLLQSDPGLSRPENRPVLERVRRLFADTPDIFN